VEAGESNPREPPQASRSPARSTPCAIVASNYDSVRRRAATGQTRHLRQHALSHNRDRIPKADPVSIPIAQDSAPWDGRRLPCTGCMYDSPSHTASSQRDPGRRSRSLCEAGPARKPSAAAITRTPLQRRVLPGFLPEIGSALQTAPVTPKPSAAVKPSDGLEPSTPSLPWWAWVSPEIGFPPRIPCTTRSFRSLSPLPSGALAAPGNPRTCPHYLSPC
jgi:hypothetical protein